VAGQAELNLVGAADERPAARGVRAMAGRAGISQGGVGPVRAARRAGLARARRASEDGEEQSRAAEG